MAKEAKEEKVVKDKKARKQAKDNDEDQSKAAGPAEATITRTTVLKVEERVMARHDKHGA